MYRIRVNKKPIAGLRKGVRKIDLGQDSPVYPVGVVKELTGLSERQIRYYDKMGLVVPKRTPGNKRLYTPNEVEKLKEIKKLIQKGMSIKEIKEYYAEHTKTNRKKKKDVESDAKSYFNRGRKKQSLYPPSYLDELIKNLTED